MFDNNLPPPGALHKKGLHSTVIGPVNVGNLGAKPIVRDEGVQQGTGEGRRECAAAVLCHRAQGAWQIVPVDVTNRRAGDLNNVRKHPCMTYPESLHVCFPPAVVVLDAYELDTVSQDAILAAQVVIKDTNNMTPTINLVLIW